MAGRTKTYLLLVIICVITIFPFLGSSYFNTKGEPREAVVSYAMLETGNWVLPESSGGDIAYKPPFFHWCIAVASSIGDEVTEFTSRMPSAIALVVMVLAGFCFFAKRRGVELAFLMAIITLTNFEVHRAGFACRVDMVLTAFIVLALYQLYRWCEKDRRGFPLLAVLFMGCAALTKGPIGIILPCLVTGVFLLIRGVNFWKAFRLLAGLAVVSCVLPALWYVAAYQQGGDNFLSLVMEENFGRFTGKMSYESHENPAYYNVITLVAGFVPYTLLVLLSLFGLKYSKWSGKPLEWWQRFVAYIRQMDPVRLFSLLSIVLIFVFYCIPKSKRSVYLLPIYPFIAYYLAEYIHYLLHKKSKSLKVYGAILSVLAVLLVAFYWVIRCGAIPSTIFHGKHGVENIAMMHALMEQPLNPFNLLLLTLPVLAAAYFFFVSRRKGYVKQLVYSILAVTICLFVSLDGFFQPTVLNVKSSKSFAEKINSHIPQGEIYSYLSDRMIRFYQINFYLGDRVKLFEEKLPEEGYLLVSERDLEEFQTKYQDAYLLEEVFRSERRDADVRSIAILYRFNKKGLCKE